MPAKSVKINTPEINKAIRAAVENAGGVEAFAELLTCSHSTISKYKSGQIEDVHAATWKRLLPLIQEYLPGEGNMTVGESNISFKGDNNSAQTGSGKNDLLLDLMEATLNDNSLSAEDKVKYLKITLKNRRK